MCSLKVSLLSILIQSNSTVSLSLITIESIFYFSFLLCFLPRIINWNFLELAFSEFVLNHYKIIFILCFRFSKMLDSSTPPLQRALSLAKLQTSQFSININRSLIKTLKSKGRKTKPWGTPLFTSDQKLHKEPIFTSCFCPSKETSINFKLILLRARASNFALIRSWSKQSHALQRSMRTVLKNQCCQALFFQLFNKLNKACSLECTFLDPHNNLFKNKSILPT